MIEGSVYSDEELLLFLSKDSEQAFDELYNRYWKKLFVIAMHTLKDQEQAEEIVHDVLLKLWSLRTTIKIEKSLNSYLAAAVKYHILNYLAKQRRRFKLLEKNNYGIKEESEETTNNWLREKELMSELLHAVSMLPEKCRIVYMMSRGEGMNTKQIASALNIPVNTIESQLSKSLKHLKLHFKDKLGIWLFL